MHSRGWFAAALVAGGALVAWAAYMAGVSQGAHQAALAAGDAGSYYYGWGWHRPWGFGFGFPFFFLFVWLVIARGIFWGGPWRRRWHYYHDDVPPSWEDWHRRAHDRMRDGAAPRT
jgi:hypothetical protein